MATLKPYPVITNGNAGIGHILCFLDFARSCTLAAVENCTAAQLDHLPGGISNSAGTLLRHIAALEFQFQQVSFNNQTLNREQMIAWYGGYANELSLNCVKHQPVTYYTALLQEQRARTRELFAAKTDEWLFAENVVVPKANNLFFWYHLAEDELCHAGQIKLILKMTAANR